MRTKKSIINSGVNIVSFIISFIPNLIIRSAFLNTLGSEMLGLNSLYSNIIGWLSIVEMGVGTAIIYSLYKPYSENNQKKIKAYIKFYKEFYRSIGFTILLLGLMISPFLSFFVKGKIDLKVATIAFVLFLLNSFISYMFSHKICILNVAQESYKVTMATTISKLVISILQLAMLNIYPSFILFTLIQLSVNFVYFVGINKYIVKKYSWLMNEDEELNNKEQKDLKKSVKAMFMHKIGGVVVSSTDNIMISKFIGLNAITKYTNYQIVISALQSVVNVGLNGLTASIGNLLVNENKDKAYDIHKKLFFINFWISSFIVISLYNTLNQFIVLWVGKTYLLDKFTFTIILINVYIGSMRGSVEQFQNGSGNFYQDRYAPICEAIINFVISLVLARKIGISGVFLGTLISNCAVIFWTKPYIVYKYVFNKSLKLYFEMYFKYLLLGITTLVITNYIASPFKVNYSLYSFFMNCIINIIVINLIYFLIFCRTSEYTYYKNIAITILTQNRKCAKSEH